MSTPPGGSGGPHINDLQPPPSAGPVSSAYASNSLPSIMNSTSQRQPRGPMSNTTYRSPPLNAGGHTSSNNSEFHPSQPSPPYATYPAVAQAYHTGNSQGPVLPPFSSIQTMGGTGMQQGSISSIRYHPTDNGISQRQQYPKHHNTSSASSSKRHAPVSSNVTSANSSDLEDDDDGELPASGLVAPWEVLRGLADVAIERAAKACTHPQSNIFF
jgi:hypothetical protein